MGSLSQITIPTAEVLLPGGGDQSLTVRGVSPEDITSIYLVHALAVDRVFARFKDAGEMPSIDEAIKTLVADAPDLAAAIIAAANDEPDEVDAARKLPAITQITALFEITRLTFDSWAEVKKILEMFADAMEKVNREVFSTGMPPIADLLKSDGATPSVNGSGTSEDTSVSS